MLEILEDLVQGWLQIPTGFDEVERADLVLESGILRLGISTKKRKVGEMGQLYLQRFEYRGAIDKSLFDRTWGIANEAMAKTGNWGNVEKGVKHVHAYGTGWGGYALLDVEDPAAFDAYQIYHANNYGQMCHVTFEPLADLDAAMAPMIAELKAKS